MPLGWEPRRFSDRLIVFTEECLVWVQTLQYAPVRGTMEFVGLLSAFGAFVACVLKILYLLLGL